jgi:ketosteroid isomerase-like protein
MKSEAFVLLAAVSLTTLCTAQVPEIPEPLKSVVESERVFAATSIQIGARPSFMKFFADDAVVFRPHPVIYKDAMKKVDPPKNPTEATLEWEPIWGDVSQSGDLGYTTGPSVWTDHGPAKRPTYYGFYFSFWKKQPAGDWKVVFDVGTELPGPYTGPRGFRSPDQTQRTRGSLKLSAKEHRASLLEAEQQFLESAQKSGVQRALAGVLDKDSRIYRELVGPLVGIESIQAYFSGRPYLSTWKTQEAHVAAAGDLGYSYGSYTVKTSDEERGYFLHAWKRDASNRWKLVAEITSPLPPERPKSK